jgi:repressor LexA
MHLTAQQNATYKFIQKYICSNDIAPTESEIAKAIGIKSRGVVHRYLKALQHLGLIEILPNRKRNIRLLQSSVNTSEHSLPILGKIAAGLPIEAINNTSSIDLYSYFAGKNRFVLQVAGDSMIGDNIRDGDYIVCEKTSEFTQSSINIILVDGEEVTLKRCRVNNTDNTVTLLSSNPNVHAQTYALDRVQIQGRYIGLLRLI